MSTQVQRRRGTSAQCDAMTPAEGEIVVDMTNDRLRLGDGIVAGGIVIPNANDIQDQSFVYAVAGGTANALTLTIAGLAAYTDGLAIEFKASNNNTGATTINVSSLGIRSISKISDGSVTSLDADDIVSGAIYRAVYNNSGFQLIGATASQTITAGDGLTQSGGVVAMNTNNALGVGAYVQAAVIGGASVSAGATVAGTSLRVVNFRGANGASASVVWGNTLTGTWRNVTGANLVATNNDVGMFMRIA